MFTDELLYAPEDTSHLLKDNPWVILIVDDDLEVHSITKLALDDFIYDHRKLLFLSAYSAAEATSILKTRKDIALVLLDVVMETDTAGLDLVKVIREHFKNNQIRIIIRTGQPGIAPARYVIDHYDINDYKEKTELTADRLYISVRNLLSQYKHMLELESKQEQIITGLKNELEAKKELQEKNELLLAQSRQAAMGEMLSMIAHQWRQPLSVIASETVNMRLQQAMSKSPGDETAQHLKTIESQIQYLSHTITDFRNFFKQDKEKTSVLPSDIINHVLTLIGKLLENNKIDLRLSISCIKPFFTFQNELQHVLINLIKNSADALNDKEKKEKWIRIVCEEENEFITFQISDNGGGIDASSMQKIFEPYFSTKHEKNGTGLGLYMSKTIIEEHLKGALSCINSNEGAVFTVKLPSEF